MKSNSQTYSEIQSIQSTWTSIKARRTRGFCNLQRVNGSAVGDRLSIAHVVRNGPVRPACGDSDIYHIVFC